MEITIDPTTSSSPSEKRKEIVDIETVEDPRQYLALPNTVADAEDRGEDAIPSDMGKLKFVDNDKKSDKDLRE